MMLTYRVRACPTRRQHAWLAECLEHTRELYNAALEERLGAWRKAGKRITLGDQGKALTELRRDAVYAAFPRRMQRWVLDRVNTAYREHVKRLADPTKPRGDIRFRGRMHWRTIGFDSPIDVEMHKRGLCQRKAFGGTLRLKRDRALPPWAQCKAITLTREERRWFVNLTYEVPDPKHMPNESPNSPIGLDLGLKSSVVRSDGARIDAVGALRDALPELRRRNRALARCKKRSRRRQKVKARLRRLLARIARRRYARLQTISARLVRHYDAVAVEDLTLRALMRSGGRNAQGRGSRRKWHDFAPGTLVSLIEWKCQRDGRNFARVDPRGSSQMCSCCDALVRKSSLRERIHSCQQCGLVLDRDHNAALNILNRAGWGPGGVNPGGRVGGHANPVRDCLGNTADACSAGPRQGDRAALLRPRHARMPGGTPPTGISQPYQ